MSEIDNVYCAVLAGGSGTRMNSPLPKQFMMLGNAPVFIHTLRTLLKNTKIKEIWLGSNGDWLELAKEQIATYLGNNEKIKVCEGGSDREGTLLNIMAALSANNKITDNDVILIHDAVRPFLTTRIIDDVICEMEFCDACNTVVPINDTVSRVSPENIVLDIPNRSELFAGQSPQGFRINKLLNAFNSLDADTRKILTDTTKVCFVNGIEVHTVRGEFYNFKITTPYDLEVANHVLAWIESIQNQ